LRRPTSVPAKSEFLPEQTVVALSAERSRKSSTSDGTGSSVRPVEVIMRRARNQQTRHSRSTRIRRTALAIGLLLPINAGLAASTATAWADTASHRPAGLCTPRHLAGCDGTDSPDFDGKHNRRLMYCGPDGTCGPVDPKAAARDTELYGDPAHRRR
jgi:hypothetical protein